VDHPAPFPPLPADPKARKKEEKRRAELAERQRKENARLAKEHEKEAARIAKQQQRDDEARRKAHGQCCVVFGIACVIIACLHQA